jgi:hypothetical protein
MRLSPSAMKAVVSDERLKDLLIKGDLDSICCCHGFRLVGKTIFLDGESCRGSDFIDFRSIVGTPEEIHERFLVCKKEIQSCGDDFVLRQLLSHITLIEDRSDFSVEKKTGYRKLMIASWHNFKISKGIEVPVHAEVKDKF